MSLRIRPSKPEEDHELGELLVLGYVHAYGLRKPALDVPEERKAYLRNVKDRRERAFVFVAENEDVIATASGNKIIGTVTLTPHGQPNTKTWLENSIELNLLVLHPDQQGSGLGKALMHHAIEFSRAQGFAHLSLHIRENISGLERFYRSFGFVRTPEGDSTAYGTIRLFAYDLKL